MKRLLVVFIVGVLLCASGTSSAGRPDPDAGHETAKVVCAPCHGLTGISLVRAYPNLAGQKEQYLIKQLEAYRSGDRTNLEAMNPLAAELSDQDIKDLAAYYSSLSGCEDSGNAPE